MENAWQLLTACRSHAFLSDLGQGPPQSGFRISPQPCSLFTPRASSAQANATLTGPRRDQNSSSEKSPVLPSGTGTHGSSG